MALSRRGLLLLGAGGTAAALTGCGPDDSPAARPSPSAAPRWNQLARNLTGRLALPGTDGYDAARLTENPRYDGARPLAVASIAGAADAATVLSFAQDNGLPVALRSGGHSYPGWSAGAGAIVVDCRGLDAVSLTGTSATIGSGAALAAVYDAIGRKGRAIPGGSCATVGIAGLTLGGGVGVLTRALGLTCDAVTAMQVVTADGRTRTVTADGDADLFWALRGGGGGHLGVVTSFTFDTATAPQLHTFYLAWPFSAAADVIAAWQDWAPTADARLWSTCKVLGGATHPSGPTILVAGTWTGSDDPDLSGLLAHVPAPTSRTITPRSYLEAMRSYAGCSSIPADRCHTGPGGDLEREAFGATSHVGYDPLDAGGIDTLLGQVEDAPTTLKEAGISMDALGGKVGDVDPDATAFVHRAALMTVQYTATFTGRRGLAADRFVRGLRQAMTPSWGEHAYVNYADAELTDPSQAYFGAHTARLREVRSTYDPDGFFTQPQDY